MKNKCIVYRNVFSREEVLEIDFETYLNNPAVVFNHFKVSMSILHEILGTKDKVLRNTMKRENLPAMDLSQSGILAIDIDNVAGDRDKINRMIRILERNENVYVAKESVSGNLVVFFKYDCSVEDFKFLYYKLYLEMTLLLSVNIDFLPEIGRLRYVSESGFYFINKESKIVTDTLKVGILPSINTSLTLKEARDKKYGSK